MPGALPSLFDAAELLSRLTMRRIEADADNSTKIICLSAAAVFRRTRIIVELEGESSVVSDDRIAFHQSRFIDMLDAAFRRHGADGLPARFRDAVAATPRHRFVHRFRVEDGPLQDTDTGLDEHLDAIYGDEVMRHVDAAGAALPSTNSQPSYVLWLLHLLGLEQGQAILEIGSGSGWLAAIMARLVGPEGQVTGIELIADLAEQSREDLAALQLNNVTIITEDGTRGHISGAPYDRAMITAATWDMPLILFDQLCDGGSVLIPIELCSGDGCHVTMMRRQETILVAEHALSGGFVPLLGARQDRAVRSVDQLPFWNAIAGVPVTRYDLPLGLMPDGTAPAAAQFRAFLGRTRSSRLIAASGMEPLWWPGMQMPLFGLVDEAEPSVALWVGGEVTGYGGLSAARELARAYQQWVEAGLPGMAAFGLEIHRAGAAPGSTVRHWTEQRGDTALVWEIKGSGDGWRRMLNPIQAAD